jgi:hypothetical protein
MILCNKDQYAYQILRKGNIGLSFVMNRHNIETKPDQSFQILLDSKIVSIDSQHIRKLSSVTTWNLNRFQTRMLRNIFSEILNLIQREICTEKIIPISQLI